jgi:site-specific DNA recombinase
MSQAIIYTRFSPRRNAGKCKSCDTQEEYCRKYCDLHDLEITGVYRDEGISGKTRNRPGVVAAIAQACELKATLVFYSLSRLARSTIDASNIAAEIEKAGANLASLKEKIDTGSSMGRFVYRMMASLGELEREQIAERTRDAMIAKQATGIRMSRFAPLGMMIDPDDDKRIIPDIEEIEQMESIGELYLREGNKARVARILTANGIESRSGEGWSTMSVCRAIKWLERTDRMDAIIGRSNAPQHGDAQPHMVPKLSRR